MADEEAQPKEPQPPDASPPGHFVSDDLRAQTANFLDELRRRLKVPKPDTEPKLGPPRRRK